MGPGKISWAISGRQPRTGMLSASKKRLSEDPAGGYENMARDHLVDNGAIFTMEELIFLLQ